MSEDLKGKRIAVLATDGVEQIELTEPVKAARDAGATVELISLDDRPVQGFNHLDSADTFEVDGVVASTDASGYDGLILPGGVANPDALRMEPAAVDFVKGFFDQGKPVAAICHAPWTLIEAGVTTDRTLTSWPSLRTDIENSGGEWVDEDVHVDGRLVTSRKPDDLPAFCKAMVKSFSS
jgi:protease I